MAAPVYTTIAASQTYIDVTWDQTVLAPSGRPGEGFSVTVNGATRYVVSASQPSGTVVRIVPAGIIQSGDTATNFTSVTATNSSLHAALLTSVLGQNVTDPNVITLTFNKIVTSANFATGLTVKANGVTVTPSSVLAGTDPRTIKITFSGGFLADLVLLRWYLGLWNCVYCAD